MASCGWKNAGRSPAERSRAETFPVRIASYLAQLARRELVMTYVIAAPCVDHSDQSCIEVCPIDCITFEPGADRKLHIDPDACIDCGQCASACPNDAVFAERDLPPAWTVYAGIDAAWYRDPPAARARVDALHPR
jgi:NAD-dependent dihydropyrimidine dehydrogenase PreA subunit